MGEKEILSSTNFACLSKISHSIALAGASGRSVARSTASDDAMDLVHAHMGSMDAFALGLVAAAAIVADAQLDAIVHDRYAGWGGELGKTVLAGKATLSDCEKYVLKAGEPKVRSGQQELIENLVAESVRSAVVDRLA